MALWQGRSKRKNTGGRYRPFRKKRAFEIAPESQFAVIREETHMKIYRTRGNNQKGRLMTVSVANVYDPKTGKAQKSRILSVRSNPANHNYVQRNILTKGAIVQTELGLAMVTSRPGQDSVVNAVLQE
ncbi:MAG: 30S ribosomal protein S8e [Candidatus Thermoplasmatota archaeon]|nr:30S ribosomal protein S8e [Euryarchaeota archaeon]MBU4032104.1 30S ribosomal protein S8e [Candidatus Thermoplasmatota archaeon]MBU4071268.1 30S ribosomal protein S8e [Candidatus Thermoplasmatota archaeon]MBU4144870.1 30S ribosomal protein S8e [Candidatus Thermoplasmatota archaeon]MBU4592667.1 30S ribosomal protein S8e [Candidatus Thermoplasmatota archaeon]